MRRYSASSSSPPSALPSMLPPFPMQPAFPTSEYYGGSATPRCQQRALRLPAGRLATGREGRHRVASHVHCVPFDGLGAQLHPDGIARTAHRSLGPGLRRPSAKGNRRGCPSHTGTSAPQHDPSTRVGRPLTTHGASSTGSLSLHLSISFAGIRRLVVPADPYVVRTAPGLARNPGSGLFSTSAGPCEDRRRSPFISARNYSASWRTGHLVDPDASEPLKPVHPRIDLRTDPGNDAAHSPPGDPQQLGDRGLGALRRQPRRGVIEVTGMPSTMLGPGHRRDGDPVARAAHPRRIRLQHHLGRAKVKPRQRRRPVPAS